MDLKAECFRMSRAHEKAYSVQNSLHSMAIWGSVAWYMVAEKYKYASVPILIICALMPYPHTNLKVAQAFKSAHDQFDWNVEKATKEMEYAKHIAPKNKWFTW